ncbi:MAG: DNA-formamidopyrimidine glycosylase family protein, partial [Sporomusa sp.]
MPEIPEIETVRMHLERKIKSQTIGQVIVNREKALNIDVQQFTGLVSDRHISDVRRRAKQIIISLSNQHSLVVHFMLEGYVRLFYANEEVAGKPSV